MKIYFAGSIRGGRQKVEDYAKIVEILRQYGNVLTEHVASPKFDITGENLLPEEIYKRDVNFLKECDILFAEISVPSLGVDYEIAYAEAIGKPVVCMYDESFNVSAMIRGNNNFKMIKYSKIEELLENIRNILEK